MKIFLTGSSGMVGRNICDQSISKKFEILNPSSKELNLLNYSDVFDYIKTNKPDMVIHAAGVVGGINSNILNPLKFLYENTQMGINVLSASKLNNINLFMNFSSSCMYPRNGKNPLDESLILKGELEPTNEGYALAKIVTTKMCEYISSESNSYMYKTVIPCNLYGKYDKFDLTHSHMIPSVIMKLHEAKVNNLHDVKIWGDGLARREFMFVEDFVDFVFYAINNFNKMPQNINVGLGFDYSINDYYKQIAKVVGYKKNFVNDLTMPVGMQQKLIDDSKLKIFGWRHSTSLKLGLEKTYDYFLKEVQN